LQRATGEQLAVPQDQIGMQNLGEAVYASKLIVLEGGSSDAHAR